MCEFTDMPRFEVDADRGALGFKKAVMTRFSFLEDRGYRIVDAVSTFVRYERDSLFVNEFHGRGSYALGVEVGRTFIRDGEHVEESYPIGYLAGVAGGAAEAAFRSRSATTAEEVERFVSELARWLEAFGELTLEGDEATYEALRDAVATEGERNMDAMRATELRRRADEGWRVGDYAAVVQAYDEIDRELATLSLRAFEDGRLAYARKRLGW